MTDRKSRSGGQGMDAYSMDLRERVAADCDAAELTQPEIAEKYNVSVSFITKLLRRRQETGSLEPKAHTGGPAPTFGERDLKKIAAEVRKRPDITLMELCAWAPKPVSDSTMSRVLIAMGLTRKKSRSMPTSVTRHG